MKTLLSFDRSAHAKAYNSSSVNHFGRLCQSIERRTLQCYFFSIQNVFQMICDSMNDKYLHHSCPMRGSTIARACFVVRRLGPSISKKAFLYFCLNSTGSILFLSAWRAFNANVYLSCKMYSNLNTICKIDVYLSGQYRIALIGCNNCDITATGALYHAFLPTFLSIFFCNQLYTV